MSEEANESRKATASLVLGIIGMIAWVIPLFGAPINITGLVMGIKGLKSPKRASAVAGVVLCIIGLIFTVINAVIGAYLGATGQHPLLRSR